MIPACIHSHAKEAEMSNMDQFWRALITGLSPEDEKQPGLWWKVPLFIAGVVFFFGMF